MKIAVVGAGPAGLTAAIALAKKQHKITVFETSNTADYQGSGVLIQPVGLMALSCIGLEQHVISLGRHIERINGIETATKKNIVAVDYNKLKARPHAIGIDRAQFWQLLYETCLGIAIKFMFNTSIQGFTATEPNQYALQDIQGQSYRGYDLIIDASGVNSKLRQYALKPSKMRLQAYGSLWTKLPLTENSFLDKNEMQVFTAEDNIGIGVMPTGVDASNSCKEATVFFNLPWQSWVPEQFDQWKNRLLNTWPIMTEILTQLTKPEQLYLAKFKHHTLKKPYGHGVVFIGDAAHAANPQLGQGINMSLVDAVVLSTVLEQQNLPLSEQLKLYAKLRRKHVLIYQSLARALSPFYQSSNQHAIILRDSFYPVLNKLPLFKEFVAYTLSGQLGSPLKRLEG